MTAGWSVPAGVELAGSVLAVPPERRRGFAHRLAAAGLGVHVDLIDAGYPRGVGVDPALLSELAADGVRPVDVHLMVAEPERHLPGVLRTAPDRITVQLETLADRSALGRVLSTAHAAGCSVWLAVAPETDADAISAWVGADRPDGVLVMLTPPGGHAEAADLDRLAVVRRLATRLPVGVDGGVTSTNLPLATRCGATYLVSGRALAASVDHHDPSEGAVS